MIFFIQHAWRRVKFSVIDKNRIVKLKGLIEKGSERKAKLYLNYLVNHTKIDRYVLAYHLTTAFYNKAKDHQDYLRQFVNVTSSSNGHGKCSSDYSPVFWLYFLLVNEFECRFIVNTHCFRGRSIKLEIEVEQDGYHHSISESLSRKLPQTTPNIYNYSIEIVRKRIDDTFDFPMTMDKACHIRIYHRVNSKTRNLILEEAFDKI